MKGKEMGPLTPVEQQVRVIDIWNERLPARRRRSNRKPLERDSKEKQTTQLNPL